MINNIGAGKLEPRGSSCWSRCWLSYYPLSVWLNQPKLMFYNLISTIDFIDSLRKVPPSKIFAHFLIINCKYFQDIRFPYDEPWAD